MKILNTINLFYYKIEFCFKKNYFLFKWNQMNIL